MPLFPLIKSCYRAYLQVLENIEGFRTLHSSPPALRYAQLRFSKDKHIIEVLKRILWHFNTPFTFFDIGAEIGYHSIAAAKWARTRATIFSFEPNPELFEVLSLNAKRHKGIHPQLVALFDHDLATQAAPVITGDHFIQEQHIEYVDLVKINTAAASLETLKGLKKTFERAEKIALILEFDAQNLTIAGHSLRDLYETLIGLGLDLHCTDSSAEETMFILLNDAEHLAQLGIEHLIGFKGYTKSEIYALLGCTDPNTPPEED